MKKNMEGERIARLEQHMVDQDKKLDEIAGKVEKILTLIQRQDSFDERLKKVETSIWRWLNPALAAAFGVILSILVRSYLENIK